MAKPVSHSPNSVLFLEDEATASKPSASDYRQIDQTVAWLQQVRDHSYGSSEDLTRLRSLARVISDVFPSRCKEIVEPIVAQVRRIVAGEDVPDLYKNTLVAMQAIWQLYPEYPPSSSPVERESISPTLVFGTSPDGSVFCVIQLDSK